MRCIYCHDRVAEDGVELGQSLFAHAECALIVHSRRRNSARAVAVATRELSAEDAQRILGDWETELESGGSPAPE